MNQRACFVLTGLVIGLGSCKMLSSGDAPSGVQVLAKAGNWRDELMHGEHPFAILEVAPDRATAQLAWRENVPDTLSEGGEDRHGLYGSFDDIDFDQQVLAVWSSGESGSCPDWITDLRTTGDEKVHAQVEDARWVHNEPPPPGVHYSCTLDYSFHRMVLAVDRDRLPSLGNLPSELRGLPDDDVGGAPE